MLIHHQLFLDELKKRLEQWDANQKVGDVFLELVSRLTKLNATDCDAFRFSFQNRWSLKITFTMLTVGNERGI